MTIAVPELRIYKVWDKPIGPHPMAMFEVNLFTPGMSRHCI
jgi:aromatic ring-cleaving dioxygenase